MFVCHMIKSEDKTANMPDTTICKAGMDVKSPTKHHTQKKIDKARMVMKNPTKLPTKATKIPAIKKLPRALKSFFVVKPTAVMATKISAVMPSANVTRSPAPALT